MDENLFEAAGEQTGLSGKFCRLRAVWPDRSWARGNYLGAVFFPWAKERAEEEEEEVSDRD